MSHITLRQALSVLAKSSPFSVTTVSHRNKGVLDDFKDQLFVKQEIEADLEKLLCTLHSNEIVFLCGSSGDGKSEILTRLYNRYQSQFRFHLDATHSFTPHQSAIEALDELFDRHSQGDQPLILGINTGMLANFAKEGGERHTAIKSVIERFLMGEFNARRPCHVDQFYFCDFEHYPKFQFSDQKEYSAFARELINNLAKPDESNLFYVCAKRDEMSGQDLQVVANFKLIGLPSVQTVIITQLFKARLIKDQFVTTRALLDLLHHLLLGPGYISDNLFIGDDNELAHRMADFDPARIHTQELDQFVLRYELGLPDAELDLFIHELRRKHIYFERGQVDSGKAASLIRLFYLLRDEVIGNNYHHQYAHHFREHLLEGFSYIWRLHKEYTGEQSQKLALRRFYTNELVAGLQRYANRKAPELATIKDELFLGSYGSVKMAAPIEIKGDYDTILKKGDIRATHFMAYLRVGEHALAPISISLNLFDLLRKLNLGYRPNKYDKNAIVLLDEILEQVTELAKATTILNFYDNNRTYMAKQDDGMIAIGGFSGVI